MIRRMVFALTYCAAVCAWADPGDARPLAVIRERGSIMLCANPNALPYAAKAGPRRDFQIEIAQALADQLHLGLDVGWVIFPFHIGRVDCDIVLDSIVDKEIQEDRHVLLSRPYQRSGVALAFRQGVAPVASYADLKPSLRVGAMVGSLARLYLGQHKQQTIPFTFEDEMIEEVGKGTLDAAVISPTAISYYNMTHAGAPVRMALAFQAVPELNWSVAVGMRKADDALVENINRALDQLIADGTLKRIYASYGIEHWLPEP